MLFFFGGEVTNFPVKGNILQTYIATACCQDLRYIHYKLFIYSSLLRACGNHGVKKVECLNVAYYHALCKLDNNLYVGDRLLKGTLTGFALFRVIYEHCIDYR